jgi:cold shock CspA family protein
MMTGVVKYWNPKRGFGFFSRDDGEDDLFGHVSQIICDVDELPWRARVSFEIGTGRRPWAREAKNIRIITDRKTLDE